MKIYDISMSINNQMPVYKNKDSKKPVIKVLQDHSNSSTYESCISMDMHTGTHIDAPLHIIENAAGMDEFDLERAVTNCRVLDFTNITDKITADTFADKNIKEGDFILLKTKNSFKEEFEFDFIYLEKSGAEYLRECRIKGIGIDSLGIERNQQGHETHRALLGNGIVIIEGLRLEDVKEGEYFLCALPLKISGVEASPARAILIEK